MAVTAAGSWRDPAPGRLRLVDRAYLLYFGVNSLLLVHPHRPDHWHWLLLLHAFYLVGIPLAVRFSGRHPLFSIFRDWYPLILLPLMYTELGLLNRVLSDRFHDHLVIGWELKLFGGQMATELRRMLPWKLLGEALHFGYFSYYLVSPTLLIPLWLRRQYRDFRLASTVAGLTYLFCYLWYIYFPVTGPYWQLPRPDPATEGWFFPQLANAIVSTGSAQGSAFPSSHIAASVAILGMSFRLLRPVFWVLLLPVILLCVGTVYGGFHYGVDALAGLILGLAIAWLVPGGVMRRDGGCL